MRLSIDIPDDTHRELKAKAASQGVTISEIVRLSVERYLHGNFTVGFQKSLEPVSDMDTLVMRRPGKPISKADQAKGKTRK